MVRHRDGAGSPTRSTGRAGLQSWPARPGSADSPRSGSLLPDEEPARPFPLESSVVQAVGASRSTSVAPALDASATGSPVGRRNVPGEQPTKAGSIQRILLDLLVAGPDAPPDGARRPPRGGA